MGSKTTLIILLNEVDYAIGKLSIVTAMIISCGNKENNYVLIQ